MVHGHGMDNRLWSCFGMWVTLCKTSRRRRNRGRGGGHDVLLHLELPFSGRKGQRKVTDRDTKTNGFLALVVVLSVWEATRRDWEEIQARFLCIPPCVCQHHSITVSVVRSLESGCPLNGARVEKRRGALGFAVCGLFTFISPLSHSIFTCHLLFVSFRLHCG